MVKERRWSWSKQLVNGASGWLEKLHHFKHHLSPNWNRLFSEPPTVYRRKRVVTHHFHRNCLKANKVSKSEWIGNTHIIFKSVLMLLTEKKVKISPSLSKLQLAKVGAFFSEKHCSRGAISWLGVSLARCVMLTIVGPEISCTFCQIHAFQKLIYPLCLGKLSVTQSI